MQIVSKDLSFTYNKKTEFSFKALDGVDITINEGDFFGIIGETGSGKSTFIQHLNGLIEVESGSLFVGDYELSNKKTFKKEKQMELRKKVGMVFQYPEYQLFAETVFEDVAFGLKNFYPNLTNEEIAKNVWEALTVVGLDYEKVKNKSPFEMSGGQRRKVAIAGVLVTKPEVLILDEPVAGLDPQMKKTLMRILHDIHGKFVKTIIIVSHDMNEVGENCNRVAVFKKGKVVSIGDTSEVLSNVELLRSLKLEAPMSSIITYMLNKNGYNIKTDFNLDNLAEEIGNIKR